MNNKSRKTTSLQVFFVILMVLAGIITLYYIVFSMPDNTIEMNQLGDLEYMDNSNVLPLMKIGLIVLPIAGLYFFIKGWSKK
jgi:O-antigen/teichoic acid export membrane protein